MQLLLFDSSPSTIESQTQRLYYFRTLITPALMGDYQPGHFSDLDADGGLFMESHAVYLSPNFGIGHLAGTVYRLTPDTPWHIAACGVPDSKTHGFDFDSAVADLITWHQQNQDEMIRWLEEFAGKSLRHNTNFARL